MTSRADAIVAEATSWLRTPWHHMANKRGVGVDCAQLLREVYPPVLEIEAPEFAPYPIDWALHRSDELLLGMVSEYADEVDGDPQPGDVVLYKYGRCFSHAAIVVEWPRVIHALRKARMVTMDDGDGGELGSRERKVFRVRGL